MPQTNYLNDLLHPDLINIEDFLVVRVPHSRTRLGGQRRVDPDAPHEPSVAWQEMAQDWLVVRDLLGGTRGMRMAGERYLPKMPAEREDEYLERLSQSFLHDVLQDAIDEMVSRPFEKPVTFTGTVPDWVEDLAEDVDGRGTTIQAFAKSLFEAGVTWGVAHAAVDVVGAPDGFDGFGGEDGSPVLAGDFGDARPRMRVVPGPNMLSWRRDLGARSLPVREVTFYERVVDDKDVKELLHVWSTEQFDELIRDVQRSGGKNGGFVPASGSFRNFAGRLPISTFQTKRTGEFTSRPPFMDVAWIAVDLWQTYSDHRNILHVARVPILMRKGFTSGAAGQSNQKRNRFVAGTRRLNDTSNTEADMRWVELQGGSIPASERHIQGLLDSVKERIARPLQSKPNVTATGEVSRDSKVRCELHSWIEDCEWAIWKAFQIASKVVPGRDLPEDFGVVIWKEFDLRDRSTTELTGLRQDRDRGDISRKAFLAEVVRRSVLPETYDAEADKVEIDKERAEGMEEELQRLAAERDATGVDQPGQDDAGGGQGGSGAQ